MIRFSLDYCAAFPLVLCFLVAAAVGTARGETFLYVSQAPEQAIRVYRMNDATSSDAAGTLAEVETVKVDGAPGASSVDPTGKFLFVSLRSTAKIGSYRIDPATGKLTLINTTKLEDGKNAAHVRTDRTGKYLLSASYAGGRVMVHAVDAEGRISAEPLQVVETAKTAHCVAVDAANENVYVPHVAPNAVYQFQFDSATGKLSSADRAPGGSPDAGPRHLAIHPGGKVAFTSDETGSSVTLYSFDDDAHVNPQRTLSTLPDDFTGKNTTAEVKVHPSGRFVWVSNRGHDSLAGFLFDGETGGLTSLGQTPTEKTPRSFEIEPSGRFLFAAGEGSGNLQAYRIDQETGALTPTKKYEVGKSLTWVTAVRLPN